MQLNNNQVIINLIDNEIKNIMGDELPILSQLKSYVVKSGGKRLRSLLTCQLAALYEINNSAIYTIAAIVEIIHAASLLHDDVLDDSKTRRGKPSGKEIFGAKEVILGGDYMLAVAIHKISEFNNSSLVKIFTQVVKDLTIAELLQLQYANTSEINLDTYMKIIYGKTASLFRTACEAVAIFGGKEEYEIEQIGKLGTNLGILFQIRDDYLDYFNPSLLQKPPMQDFENQFYTYPIINYFEQNGAEKNKITEFFNLDLNDRKKSKTQNQLLSLLKELNCDSMTLAYMNELKNDVLDQLNPFNNSTELKQLKFQIEKLMILE